MEETEEVTRVEVIDHTKNGKGRAFVKWEEDLRVHLELQDSGRTLKVFLSERS